MRTKQRNVAELTNDPRNVRSHPTANIEAIKRSLQAFGQQKPIVVDSRGVVIAGNGTLMAAVELGWTRIDTVESELEDEDARA